MNTDEKIKKNSSVHNTVTHCHTVNIHKAGFQTIVASMQDKGWEILWLLKFQSSQQVHLMMFTIPCGPCQQIYLRTQVPQSQSLVPGSRQSELAIGWHDDIRYKVTVSFQTFKWKSVVCVIPGQLPHNKSFIYKTIVKHWKDEWFHDKLLGSYWNWHKTETRGNSS